MPSTAIPQDFSDPAFREPVDFILMVEAYFTVSKLLRSGRHSSKPAGMDLKPLTEGLFGPALQHTHLQALELLVDAFREHPQCPALLARFHAQVVLQATHPTLCGMPCDEPYLPIVDIACTAPFTDDLRFDSEDFQKRLAVALLKYPYPLELYFGNLLPSLQKRFPGQLQTKLRTLRMLGSIPWPSLLVEYKERDMPELIVPLDWLPELPLDCHNISKLIGHFLHAVKWMMEAAPEDLIKVSLGTLIFKNTYRQKIHLEMLKNKEAQ